MFKKLIFLGLVLLYSAVALKNETVVGDTNETAFKALHGPRYEKEFPGPAPVYEINLDLPYEERWRKVMTEIGKPHIEPLFNWFVGKAMLSDDVINALNFTVLEAYDKEFALEIQAIAKILELPFEKVLLLNTFFDATTMCTGIIIQDADNNVYHGRNLDFALAPVMSRMIFHGKYMKDGKLLYQAITKVGQVGLLTGIKKGAFTINLNQNMDPTTGADFYWNNIKHIVTGIYDEMKNHYTSQQTKKATHLKHVGPALKFSPLLIARKGIETCNSYEEMVQYLKDTPTFSRVFYIVAGTQAGEGTIITKKGDAVEHVKILDASTEYWFLLQANYAHNFTDPVYDNRYSAGKAQLSAIGKDKITKERLFNEVLHAYPIYNNGSIHTTIMQASTDLFNTTVWYWDESIKA